MSADTEPACRAVAADGKPERPSIAVDIHDLPKCLKADVLAPNRRIEIEVVYPLCVGLGAHQTLRESGGTSARFDDTPRCTIPDPAASATFNKTLPDLQKPDEWHAAAVLCLSEERFDSRSSYPHHRPSRVAVELRLHSPRPSGWSCPGRVARPRRAYRGARAARAAYTRA